MSINFTSASVNAIVNNDKVTVISGDCKYAIGEKLYKATLTIDKDIVSVIGAVPVVDMTAKKSEYPELRTSVSRAFSALAVVENKARVKAFIDNCKASKKPLEYLRNNDTANFPVVSFTIKANDENTAFTVTANEKPVFLDFSNMAFQHDKTNEGVPVVPLKNYEVASPVDFTRLVSWAEKLSTSEFSGTQFQRKLQLFYEENNVPEFYTETKDFAVRVGKMKSACNNTDYNNGYIFVTRGAYIAHLAFCAVDKLQRKDVNAKVKKA